MKQRQKKISIVAKLKENSHLPIEDRMALYHKLKDENLALYDFDNETELTLYGYSFSLSPLKSLRGHTIFQISDIFKFYFHSKQYYP